MTSEQPAGLRYSGGHRLPADARPVVAAPVIDPRQGPGAQRKHNRPRLLLNYSVFFSPFRYEKYAPTGVTIATLSVTRMRVSSTGP